MPVGHLMLERSAGVTTLACRRRRLAAGAPARQRRNKATARSLSTGGLSQSGQGGGEA